DRDGFTERHGLQKNVLLDCRIDLDAQFLLIFLETGKLNSYYVLACNKTRKVVLTFHVANALKSLITGSFTAQNDDHSRKSFALVWDIGNHFAGNSASLRWRCAVNRREKPGKKKRDQKRKKITR